MDLRQSKGALDHLKAGVSVVLSGTEQRKGGEKKAFCQLMQIIRRVLLVTLKPGVNEVVPLGRGRKWEQ